MEASHSNVYFNDVHVTGTLHAAMKFDNIEGELTDSDKIANNTIQTNHIGSGMVKNEQLSGDPYTDGEGASSDTDLDRAVNSDKIRIGAIKGHHIADNSITPEHMGATTIFIGNTPLTFSAEADADGPVHPLEVLFGDVHFIETGHVALDAIENKHIADNAVKSEQIDTAAVTSIKIKTDAVTNDKLKSNGANFTPEQRGAAAVDNDKLQNYSVDARTLNPSPLHFSGFVPPGQDPGADSTFVDTIPYDQIPATAAVPRNVLRTDRANVTWGPRQKEYHHVGWETTINPRGDDHGRVFMNHQSWERNLIGETVYQIGTSNMLKNNFAQGTTYRFIGHSRYNNHTTEIKLPNDAPYPSSEYIEEEGFGFYGNQSTNLSGVEVHGLTARDVFEGAITHMGGHVRTLVNGTINWSYADHSFPSNRTGTAAAAYTKYADYTSATDVIGVSGLRHSLRLVNYTAYDITLISGIREFETRQKRIVWYITGTVSSRSGYAATLPAFMANPSYP